jgi:hypothetical protein
MRVRAAGNHGDYSGHPEFRAFLNRPFHAIELEDGENEGYAGLRSCGNNLAELKLHPVTGDAYDPTAADAVSGRDVEFLPDSSAKHLRKVLGMRSDQSSAIAGNFVGDPAAACHMRPVILSGANSLASERIREVEGPPTA